MFTMFETKLSWESPMIWLVHTHSRGCRGTSRCCKQFLCSLVISGEKPLQSGMFRCQVFLLGGSLEIKGLLFRYSSYSCPLPLHTCVVHTSSCKLHRPPELCDCDSPATHLRHAFWKRESGSALAFHVLSCPAVCCESDLAAARSTAKHNNFSQMCVMSGWTPPQSQREGKRGEAKFSTITETTDAVMLHKGCLKT